MTKQEAIETIKLALSQVEWDYPMDYAVAFDMAISAMEKQDAPDTNADTISRQDAIDCFHCWVDKHGDVHEPDEMQEYRDIEALPPTQSEPSEDAEFWRKRAEYYSKMCLDLIADMNQGVRIDSIEINEEGIKFKKTQPETCDDAVNRQAAIDAVIKRDANCGIDSAEVLKTLPPAQPEIIRCKDCKYRYVDGENVRFNVCELNHNKVQSDNWYCADAERREE